MTPVCSNFLLSENFTIFVEVEMPHTNPEAESGKTETNPKVEQQNRPTEMIDQQIKEEVKKVSLPYYLWNKVPSLNKAPRNNTFI